MGVEVSCLPCWQDGEPLVWFTRAWAAKKFLSMARGRLAESAVFHKQHKMARRRLPRWCAHTTSPSRDEAGEAGEVHLGRQESGRCSRSGERMVDSTEYST